MSIHVLLRYNWRSPTSIIRCHILLIIYLRLLVIWRLTCTYWHAVILFKILILYYFDIAFTRLRVVIVWCWCIAMRSANDRLFMMNFVIDVLISHCRLITCLRYGTFNNYFRSFKNFSLCVISNRSAGCHSKFWVVNFLKKRGESVSRQQYLPATLLCTKCSGCYRPTGTSQQAAKDVV